MVVAHAGCETEAAADQEVAHDGLEAGLSTLEVGAGKQAAVLTGVLDDSGVESVLGRAIQIKHLLLNSRNTVKDRSGEWLVCLDASLEIIKGVDLWEKEHLGIGSPQKDNLVSAGLHVLDILLDGVNELAVGAGSDVIGAFALVSCDVVGIQSGRQGSHSFEVILELFDEGGLEHASPLGSLIQVHSVDVPSTDLEVDRVRHGEQILDGLVDILKSTGLLVEFKSAVSGGRLGERSVKVCLLLTVLRLPGELAFVGDDTSCEGGAIVAAEADKHDANLGDGLLCKDAFSLENSTRSLLGFVVKSESVLVGDVDGSVSHGLGDTGQGASGHVLKLVGAFWHRVDNLHGLIGWELRRSRKIPESETVIFIFIR